MSSVARTMSGLAGRLQARRQARYADFVFCPTDGYWFRPAYTDGKCPLCGEIAPSGVPAQPFFRRLDRSLFGVGVLALESLGMLALVLFMYYKG